MSNDVIKAVAGDINPEFYEQLLRTFPQRTAVYEQGRTLEDLAYQGGIQFLITWIKQHARM